MSALCRLSIRYIPEKPLREILDGLQDKVAAVALV